MGNVGKPAYRRAAVELAEKALRYPVHNLNASYPLFTVTV